MEQKRVVALILAAGQGKRMNSNVRKQYLLLHEKPVLYYSLKAFEESSVDEIVIVTGKEELDYCKKNIVEYYGFQKVKKIIEGGKERYDSSYAGLCSLQNVDYVLIHDGARPFVTIQIIEAAICAVKECDACVVGMPVKDTVKIVDSEGYVRDTPEREKIWAVQTPQAFSYPLIKAAYDIVMQDKSLDHSKITDDAMIVESVSNYSIRLISGSYQNIKITTPEDIKIGEVLLEELE